MSIGFSLAQPFTAGWAMIEFFEGGLPSFLMA
jgi:hypothetical protein